MLQIGLLLDLLNVAMNTLQMLLKLLDGAHIRQPHRTRLTSCLSNLTQVFNLAAVWPRNTLIRFRGWQVGVKHSTAYIQCCLLKLAVADRRSYYTLCLGREYWRRFTVSDNQSRLIRSAL